MKINLANANKIWASDFTEWVAKNFDEECVEYEKLISLLASKRATEGMLNLNCAVIQAGNMTAEMCRILRAAADSPYIRKSMRVYDEVASKKLYSFVALDHDLAHGAVSGSKSQIMMLGVENHVASSGDNSLIISLGKFCRIAAAGDFVNVLSYGDCARIVVSGLAGEWRLPIVAMGRRSSVTLYGYRPFILGEDSDVCVLYMLKDGSKRAAFGKTGDNLKAGVKYSVDSDGTFIEC